jgi:hypothetical protein
MSTVFLDFLHKFDGRMGLASRKALLFSDKCPADHQTNNP